MPSPSDFPEKVWLTDVDVMFAERNADGGIAALVDGSSLLAEWREDVEGEIQPYFSAPLVTELVEALRAEVAAFNREQCQCDPGDMQHEATSPCFVCHWTDRFDAALSKAQSSLGVKG